MGTLAEQLARLSPEDLLTTIEVALKNSDLEYLGRSGVDAWGGPVAEDQDGNSVRTIVTFEADAIVD